MTIYDKVKAETDLRCKVNVTKHPLIVIEGLDGCGKDYYTSLHIHYKTVTVP